MPEKLDNFKARFPKSWKAYVQLRDACDTEGPLDRKTIELIKIGISTVLLHEGGLRKMHKFISDTAAYGDLVSGPRVVDANSRKHMKAVLKDIQDGTFARNWIAENEAGMPEFKRLMKADLEHPIEKVGAELRGRMDWLEE